MPSDAREISVKVPRAQTLALARHSKIMLMGRRPRPTAARSPGLGHQSLRARLKKYKAAAQVDRRPVLRAHPMRSFRGSRLVRHAAADMFDLVADFESYPQFVPFCLAARIRHRAAGPGAVETLIAEMEVGLGSIRERFATRDTLDRERLRIRIVDLDGPFRRFEFGVVVSPRAWRPRLARRVLDRIRVPQSGARRGAGADLRSGLSPAGAGLRASGRREISFYEMSL